MAIKTKFTVGIGNAKSINTPRIDFAVIIDL